MHILLAILAACLTEKSDRWGPDGKVPVKVETVASGLETPWSFAFLGGGDVLVSERPGRVRPVRPPAPPGSQSQSTSR